MRTFPIRLDDALNSIPWDAIAPHERQAFQNHHAPLEQIAARGGLTPEEALAVIEDRPWERMAFGEARQQLIDHISGNSDRMAAAVSSREACVREALTMVRALRKEKLAPTRYNLNKLEALLERVL